MNFEQERKIWHYWNTAFKSLDRLSYESWRLDILQVYIRDIYYDVLGVPLTRTTQYIDKLWKEKYSEYDSLDDFEFTDSELFYISCMATDEIKHIDKSYIYGALGNYSNYDYIIRQANKLQEKLDNLNDEIYGTGYMDEKSYSDFINDEKEEHELEKLSDYFIRNFDMIYNNPFLLDADEVTLVDDMQRYLDTYKNKWFEKYHEICSKEKLDDEFFNMYFYPSDFVRMDDEEERMYDEFAVDCILNGNVEENIRKIIDKKNLKK